MRQYIHIFLIVLTGLIAQSCSFDLIIDEAETKSNSEGYTFAFTLKVDGTSTSRSGDTWGDSYTTDTADYDCTINTDDVHVAIFDTNGNLVINVDRLTCINIATGTYQFYGKIDDDKFTDGAEYRCMVVANNGGEVDFANIGTLTYQTSALPQGHNVNNFYIPMWGVQTFTFNKRNESQDVGCVYMLRAAAKCRIHFSDDLLNGNPDLKLKNVQFNCLTDEGYVVPAGYNTVGETQELSYVDCFNPAPAADASTTEATQIDFISETDFGNLDNGSSSAIGYFAECSTGGSNVAYLTLTLVSSNGECEYTVPIEITGTTSLTRNHVYDLEITQINYGMTITMRDLWGIYMYNTDFTNQITFNGTPLTWAESTYGNIDNDNKTITLRKGVELIAEIPLLTPTNCTWLATLTPTDADDTTNAIVFSNNDNNTYCSGTIDGINKVTLRIVAADNNNTMQHKSSLAFYVQFADGSSHRVTELDGWTIVQPY